MNSPIDARPEHVRLVQRLLREYVPGHEVRVFGSRVNGTAKPMSDLDLCIMGDDLTPATLDQLRTAFSESVLPFKVDVVAWAELTDRFQKIIASTSTVIQVPTKSP